MVLLLFVTVEEKHSVHIHFSAFQNKQENIQIGHTLSEPTHFLQSHLLDHWRTFATHFQKTDDNVRNFLGAFDVC